MVPSKPGKSARHVTITIDTTTYEKLDEIARRTDLSIPAVLKKMVENYSYAEEEEEDSVE